MLVCDKLFKNMLSNYAYTINYICKITVLFWIMRKLLGKFAVYANILWQTHSKE